MRKQCFLLIRSHAHLISTSMISSKGGPILLRDLESSGRSWGSTGIVAGSKVVYLGEEFKSAKFTGEFTGGTKCTVTLGLPNSVKISNLFFLVKTPSFDSFVKFIHFTPE